MLAKLVVVGGKANREEIRLRLPTTVGRSRKSSIVIDHHTVSRQHCELYEEQGKVHVRDLGSLNGTFVDGDQVQGACLEHGAELAIGPLTFQVVYNHLAAPAKPAADDTVRPDEPEVGPEMAQTVVDLPRVAQQEAVDELPVAPTAAPLVDLSSEDDLNLSLPADEPVASSPTVEESEPAPDLASDDDFELLAEGTDLEPDAKLAPPVSELVFESPSVEDGDQLGFEIAAEADNEIAPTAAEPAPSAAAPPDEDDFLSMMAEETAVGEAAPAPHVEPGPAAKTAPADDDDFLAMMAEETVAAPKEQAPVAAGPEAAPGAPAAATDDDFLDMLAEESASIDAATAAPAEESELSFDEPSPESLAVETPTETSVAPPADELDWLAAEEPTSGEPADVDLNELAANMPPNPALGAETVIEEVEELRFEIPEAAAPVEPPAPVVKKKRGLWPFGRKQKAAKEAVEESPADAPAAPSAETDVPAEPPVPEVIGAETVIMETVEIEADADVAAEEPVVDIRRTQHVSHEKTVILEPATEVALDEAASPPETKSKRGLFRLGRKSKAATPEAPAEPAAVVSTEATPEPAAVMEAVDAATEAPVKKRGWWPFAKKAKSASVGPDAAPALEAPASAPARPTVAPSSGPTPESFEFSDEELLEITAESSPPTTPQQPNPQDLAPDEVLDFELDIPLHDSSGNISPVLSDAPPPATGADEDDFLDFLAEEIPGAKRKRSG